MTEFEILTKAAQEKGYAGVEFQVVWEGHNVYDCTFHETPEELGVAGLPVYLWLEGDKVIWADGKQYISITKTKLKLKAAN